MGIVLGFTLITTEVTDLSTQKYVPVLQISAAIAVLSSRSSSDRVGSFDSIPSSILLGELPHPLE